MQCRISDKKLYESSLLQFSKFEDPAPVHYPAMLAHFLLIPLKLREDNDKTKSE